MYHGPWINGYQKTEFKGVMTRPDGSHYEGTWLQGRKHGSGRQIYADETGKLILVYITKPVSLYWSICEWI